MFQGARLIREWRKGDALQAGIAADILGAVHLCSDVSRDVSEFDGLFRLYFVSSSVFDVRDNFYFHNNWWPSRWIILVVSTPL